MKQLRVELAERSYPIFIGENLLQQAENLLPYLQSEQLLIVTNETVAPLYLPQLHASLQGYQYQDCILPDGEQYKTLQYFAQILDSLLTHKFNRRCTLIALGGGVIGDMAGFAAACYQRGVNFIQIPTTLLSQVDSSVGGKTAVNHPKGKNMIGAFYQPQLVLADVSVLQSLPKRELAAGMAEVIKYGIIWDAEFFVWLEQNAQRIMQLDYDAIGYAVYRSCSIKADVVAQDETEQSVRALLNLGHTYGHAIETEMGYGVVLHGEAVAIGTVLACETACELGLMTAEQMSRVIDLFKQCDLPVTVPEKMTVDAFLAHMAIDKKVESGVIRLIIPHGIGRAEIHSDITTSVMKRILQRYVVS